MQDCTYGKWTHGLSNKVMPKREKRLSIYLTAAFLRRISCCEILNNGVIMKRNMDMLLKRGIVAWI